LRWCPDERWQQSFLPAAIYNSQGLGAESLTIADFDGDGHLDIAVSNQCGSFGCGKRQGVATTTVLFGTGDGTVRQAFTYGTNFAADRVIAADLNSDGRPDLIVGNASLGGLGAISVILNGGVANDTTAPGITLHATGKIVTGAHGHVLQISISGLITDDLSGVNPNGASFIVADSGGNVRRKGAVYLGGSGQYLQAIDLAPTAKYPTLQGNYKITIQAKDNAQNTRSKTVALDIVQQIELD
jgi:hypothetical protein